jgi:CRP-like cAMP-binding protein
MQAHFNQLLAQIDSVTFGELERHSTVVNLSSGDVIAEPHHEIEKVYFLHEGLVSSTVALGGGNEIETHVTGRDGVLGATQTLIGQKSINSATVHVGGNATAISSKAFVELAEKHESLRNIVLRYELFRISALQQVLACNALHSVVARTCRWMLRTHDLVGDNIAITQEHLAQILGVRRTSITAVSKSLQREEAISVKRGHIQVLDIAKIRARACECHRDIQERYRHFCR